MGNINFKANVIHFQNKKNKTTTLIALFSATEKPILVKQCSFDRSVKMSINTQIRNKRAFFLSTEERCTPYDAKMSKIKQEPYSTLICLEWRGGLAAGATMANLTSSISAVFNKGFFFFFSILPPFFPPPGLRGRSRHPRRLQTDVLGGAEHALLDVTSSYGAVKETKWLSALQRPQYGSQTLRFEFVGLSPSP